MKKILVTGGAGFLGSHLCTRLVEAGEHVICMDNLMTGCMANINRLFSYPNFKFIQQDVQQPIDIEADQIYNAACPASPPAYQKSPTDTTKTCILGILNMLELAKKNDAVLLQFSTSEVYGNPEVTPQPENYCGYVNPIGKRSCYDEGKRCAESLCFDYHREFGTDIKIVRIFNTFGPGMDPDDGRVISNFITQALRGEDLTVYGCGSQTRSFCYVDDLIEGLIRVMNTERHVTGPFNLGNPHELTMLEVAEKVLAQTGGQGRIIHKPLPEDDPVRRKPDITKARAILGWEPLVSLDVGMGYTIQYFSELFCHEKQKAEEEI